MPAAIHLLIKPASGNCNLRCRYCFYEDETEKRAVKSYGLMEEATLELLLKKALSFASRLCVIAFQGGEPTLAGLPFYRRVVELVRQYNVRHLEIQYAIQTNGCLLDDAWAAFFAQHRFLVGLSLDGVKQTHDCYRVDAQGNGTFSAVMHASQLLQKHGVDYNILTVVHAQTVRQAARLYGFYKKNGFRYLQFIPCLDPLGEPRGMRAYSLEPARYGEFLKTLFDLWYQDIRRGEMVSIRWFDNLVGMCLGYPPESCGMSGVCAPQLVVEADGGVYPCDFYVLDAYCLGNICQNSLEEIEARRREMGFIERSRAVSGECRACRHFFLCRGGCRRDREVPGEEALAPSCYCESYRAFFDYATPRLRELAALMQRRRATGVR